MRLETKFIESSRFFFSLYLSCSGVTRLSWSAHDFLDFETGSPAPLEPSQSGAILAPLSFCPPPPRGQTILMGAPLAPEGPESGLLGSADWCHRQGRRPAPWFSGAMGWSPQPRAASGRPAPVPLRFVTNRREASGCSIDAQTERLTNRTRSDSGIGQTNSCCFHLGADLGARIKTHSDSTQVKTLF